MNNKVKSETKKESELVYIVPLKDHVIVHNEFNYVITKGVSIRIDSKFLEVLKTENVINKG